MKLIPLTRGLFAQVDDWNYDSLMQWKWRASKHKHTYYAARSVQSQGEKTKCILMHRLIMNTPDNMEVDHQDHNGLNCLEGNMRNCTYSQNAMNRISKNKLNLKGVNICNLRCRKKNKKTGEETVYTYGTRFRSQIWINNKSIHLGVFKSKEEAALAYDKAAKEHFGEFARTNF